METDIERTYHCKSCGRVVHDHMDTVNVPTCCNQAMELACSKRRSEQVLENAANQAIAENQATKAASSHKSSAK